MKDHIESLKMGRRKKKTQGLEGEIKVKDLFLLGAPLERRHRTPEVPFLFICGGGGSQREGSVS